MKAFFFLFIFLISILCSCTHITLKNKAHEDLLRSTIVNNIKIPFLQADTLIYLPERTGNSCLNAPKRWNRRYYAPHLGSSPCKEILLSKYPGTILFPNRNRDFYSEESDTSKTQKKVFMEISGFIYRKNKIEVSESYYYIDKGYFVQKLYRFKKNQWSYIIINEISD